MAATTKPTYWTALNITEGASRQKIAAAYRKIAKELHPDVAPERAAEFALVTAAFNSLKANPLHYFGSKADRAWQRDYIAASGWKAPRAERAAKPKASKVNDGFVFEDIEGESKEDRRKRYARTRQQWRYARDSEYAAARRAASKKSHAKAAASKKPAKEAAA